MKILVHVTHDDVVRKRRRRVYVKEDIIIVPYAEYGKLRHVTAGDIVQGSTGKKYVVKWAGLATYHRSAAPYRANAAIVLVDQKFDPREKEIFLYELQGKNCFLGANNG